MIHNFIISGNIADSEGRRATPSIIAFTKSKHFVGQAAKDQIAVNPRNTIFDTKRLIGRRFRDVEVQSDVRDWPFTMVDRGSSPVPEVDGRSETKQFTPEEISAMILTKMRKIAETHLGQTITNANAVTVITVPAYFNDSQRQATKEAGLIAELNNPRVLNEASAAALAYGFGKQIEEERDVLVFDLGGGTCDVSLLEIQNGTFKVMTTAGDTHLGGGDFDQCLVRHFLSEFERKHKRTIKANSQALCRLRSACEQVKCTLSSQTKTSVQLESLVEGIDFNISITREEFESPCKNLFSKAECLVEQVLKDAKMDKSSVDEVVLVGGSTRIPKVRELFRSFSQEQVTRSVGPDEADKAVAYGASVQAAILQPDAPSNISQNVLLLDVAPFSVGIEAANGAVATLIKRNTIIPTRKSTMFTVHSNKISVFEVHGKSWITFDIDANGIMTLSATEAGSSKTGTMTIFSDKGRLASEEIDRMLREATDYQEAEGQNDHILTKISALPFTNSAK
ncbi:heat shock protein 70 [Penicillium atrosanguineum]|uniref:non-chaperonin molecular chaperone ATPase n=1 Tax=Penicillium atrosanguineum TaxID=1132637 RepID=A0A9W9U682_9EURO|nr:heat shock protein 70 [Penicillium atrosanguineum]